MNPLEAVAQFWRKAALRFWIFFLMIFGPCIGALIAFFAIYQTEVRFFPVVTNFKIEVLQKEIGDYVVSGTYKKQRPCEFVATNIIAVGPNIPATLIHQVKLTDIGANISTGLIQWGPYRIPEPKSFNGMTEVRIIGVHRCHVFWSQETVYGVFPIELFR
jgi:hypothetical protein